MAKSDWYWKSATGKTANLLYEPGNWGDVLKGAWVLEVALWLSQTKHPLRCLDVFAGAPTYPLPPKGRRRLSRMGGSRLEHVLEPFVKQEVWPSASRMIVALLKDQCVLHVYDKDRERLDSWQNIADVHLREGQCGWSVLNDDSVGSSADLLLVDPYDLLAEWRQCLDAILEHVKSSNVLLYVYNRSAQGVEHLRTYRDFRNRLDDAWGEEPRLIGRVPADGFLPRAHHEMILLPSLDSRGDSRLPDLLTALGSLTRNIAAVIMDGAIVEE